MALSGRIAGAVSIAILCALCARAEEASVAFPPHPRLLYSRAELDAWRADTARQKELNKAIADAEAILSQGPLVVPDKGGQWIFYYSHPETGAPLEAKSATEHWCPSTKTWHNDERTVAAYRTILGNRTDDQVVVLATAYGLTGDEKYARAVRDAQVRIAAIWPTLGRHDRWGRNGLFAVVGGRRYAQLLDEAVGLIKQSQAYDLVCTAACYSTADRTAVEDTYLRACAREILRYGTFAGTENNHRTWFNAAFCHAGIALGDEALVRESLSGSYGLLWQLEHSVTSDGIWYEGTMAYHMYALSAIMQHLDAARHIGITLAENPKLKSHCPAPAQLAYPNGQFPAINDSDRVSLSSYRHVYRWGLEYFRDNTLAPFADPASAAPSTPLPSRDLPGIGLANLRMGTGSDAACVFVDYGIHGDGHGHPDKLNLVLYGLGRELFLDPGRITYRVPEYTSWARQTVAHNTVVIDRRSQRPDTGRLLTFETAPAYAACVTESTGAYPGITLRRATVLAAHWCIDAFLVSAEDPVTMDWLLHGGTALFPPADATLTPVAKPLGTADGYEHLSNTHRVEIHGTARFDFAYPAANPLPAARVAVYPLMPETAETFGGMGIGYEKTQRIPFLLRRVKAREALFVTAVDFSGSATETTKIGTFPIEVDAPGSGSTPSSVGVRICADGMLTEWRISLSAPLPGTDGRWVTVAQSSQQ